MKTTLKTKIALIIFGLSAFFVLLEAGLRLAGFVLLSMQEHRNRQTIKQKGAYRIMCLGESTTQNQYPQFLEIILNQRDIGVRFSVIDKGIAGTNTQAILSQVESYLDGYHPDLVVAMMGINDDGAHIPYEEVARSKITLLFKSFRTYKLTRLLWLHILTKTKNTQTSLPGARSKEPYTPKNDKAYAELGWFYRNHDKFPQAEDSFKKAIEINPENDNAYFGLGKSYLLQGKFAQAEDTFKKLIERNLNNYRAYIELGWTYRVQGKFPQAEDTFKKLIERNLKDDRGNGAIALLYEEIGNPELAKEYVKKANSLRLEYYNPTTVNSYRKLKEILDKRGIKLVCVQYPMRSMEPLKRIFKGDEEGVIFVDNEAIFRRIVKNSGAKEVFADMFAGDFGHCTEKGNRILAENIADVILKKVRNLRH